MLHSRTDRKLLNAHAGRALALAALASLATGAASGADCFDAAAATYASHGVSAPLLRAIASAESDMRPAAVNASHLSRTRTRDIGLMQVNTSWLPTLARFGIDEARLFEPCTNIHVGAWILAGAFARQGANWSALGSYNASCTQLRGEACTRARARYAWRVYRRFQARDQVLHLAPPTSEQTQVAKAALSTGLVSVASSTGTAAP